MENLNKNIHFIVFGVGALLGFIFLGVGMYIRSGTESDLATEQGNLSKLGAVPTKGSLDKAEELSARFDGSLTTAEKILMENQGTLFTQNYKDYSDGLQFYSQEARAKMEQLKTRFAAMEAKAVPLPALLDGWEFTSNSAKAAPWTQLDQEMSNPQGSEKIREMQMRLRLLDEVVTTAEKLLETGAGDGMGVKLVEIKFPSPYGPSGSNEMDSPWNVIPSELVIECSPAFSILLAEELGNPSQRTLTPTVPSDASKPVFKRIGFPVHVEMLQTVMIGRQSEMRYQVLNEDKPGVLAAVNAGIAAGEPKLPVPPDPKAIDPEKPDGIKLMDEMAKSLNEKDRMVLPVQAGLKIRAAAFNKNWRAVKVEAENQ